MLPIVEDDDEFMKDTLEYMIHDIGVDAFKNSNVVDTLQKDMEDSLYPGCKFFIIFSVVLRLFNLKERGGWTDKTFTELLNCCKKYFHKVTRCRTVFMRLKRYYV